MGNIVFEIGETNIKDKVAKSLAQMAGRSPRAQADVGAVLRKDGIQLLKSDRERYIDMLVDDGLVENVIFLSDGGMLLTVTAKGMNRSL